MFARLGIRARLTIFFLLFIMAATTVVSLIAYNYGRIALTKATRDQLESVITVKEKAINSWIAEEKRMVELLTKIPLVRELSSVILTHHELDPNYKLAYDTLQNYLDSISAGMEDLLRISILSTQGGREILSTERSQVGLYHLTDSFFTLGRQQTYVQKIHYSEHFGRLAVIIATPLKNMNDEVLGVVYIALDPGEISAIVQERAGLGFSGETYLVDVNHVKLSSKFGDQVKWEKINSIAVQNALRFESGNGLYRNYNGKMVLGFYSWLEEPRLALIAEIAEEEALAPLYNFRSYLALATFGVTLSALLVAFVVARQITKPILVLSEAAQSFERGEFKEPAKVVRNDEIGRLATIFNSMIQTLNVSLQDKDQALENLKKTNVSLQEATKAKNVFLANMSHELRTPLNAIIGYSELLSEDAADLGHADYIPDLSKIQAAAQHLLTLISDILDLAKIEEGKIELYYEHLPIKQLVDEVVSTTEPLFHKQENLLKVICAEDIGEIEGDLTRIRQMLINLMSNASKFTKQGEVTLKVEKKRLMDVEWGFFSVEDTGIGISEDQKGRIFSQFIQADASTTKKFGGAGLGLSITKHFSEMMGGSLHVHSTIGKGSVFTLRLPIHRPKQLQDAQTGATGTDQSSHADMGNTKVNVA